MGAPHSNDDHNRVSHVITIAVCMLLALVAVIFRLWARRIKKNPWELSDYLIVAGIVWGAPLGLFTIRDYIYGGLGNDMAQAGSPQAIQKFVVHQGKSLLVGQITWAVSVFFIRASVLALYIRIFRTQPFRITGFIVHFFNAAHLIAVVLAACLICRPLAYSWDPHIPGGTCGDQKSLDIYIGTMNLFLDIAVVVLPMPVLWRLQMALGRKLVLSGMFGLGIIICVLTFVRIKIASQNNGANTQKIYSLIAFYTQLEILLGVINACLPVMKPLFTKFHSSRTSSWLSSVMSGSIPIFLRLSRIGSHWRRSSPSKRSSTHGHPLQHEIPSWTSKDKGDDVQLSADESPPRYTTNRPAHLSPTYNPIQNPLLKSPRPSAPPKSKAYSAWRRCDRADEEDPGAVRMIYVERTFDVERGDLGDGDRQGLVRGASKQSW